MPLVPFPATSDAALVWDGTGAKPPATAAGQFLVDSRVNRVVAVAGPDPTRAWITITAQHTYVGDGRWDGTIAPPTYGMPAGTLPDPTANPPAPNDLYINTHDGSVVVFN